jgi:CRISPR-associated protein Cas1
MAWRVICIENPAGLTTKDNKIVIKQDQEVLIPLEDIDSLVLDSYGINTSVNLLTEVAAHNIAVVICDDKHLPASVLLPYSQHSRQAKVSREQLAMSEPLKKQLWQKIVAQKITNQAAVMKKAGLDNAPLLKLSKEVRSGDTTNRESQAARLYFSALLDDATRRKPIWHNAALNYGYAIVRSIIARSIAARGLVASQGIFHRSELNSFNLADDLIETFRPAVDEYIMLNVALNHIGSQDERLSKTDRENIIDIANQYVIIDNKRFTIKHACDMVVESLVKAIKFGNADDLNLPDITN